MEESKSKILSFMTEIYSKTKWPYVTVGAIVSHMNGKYPRDALNELFKEGRIKVHDCAKGKLIELVIKEE
jgi:hypothetical protein